MSEPESPAPLEIPIVFRFRTVHLEPQLVVVGAARRPDRHVLVLALSKSAAAGLAQACLGIVDALPDDQHAMCPLALPGTLMPEDEALWVIRAKAEARKAAREERPT